MVEAAASCTAADAALIFAHLHPDLRSVAAPCDLRVDGIVQLNSHLESLLSIQPPGTVVVVAGSRSISNAVDARKVKMLAGEQWTDAQV